MLIVFTCFVSNYDQLFNTFYCISVRLGEAQMPTLLESEHLKLFASVVLLIFL